MRKRLIAAICGVILAACTQPEAAHHPAPVVYGTIEPAGNGAAPRRATPGSLVASAAGVPHDEADKKLMWDATQYALEYGKTGEPRRWKNSDTGHYGVVIPARNYQDNGSDCREYQQRMVIGGQTRQAYGRACRRDGGTWTIQPFGAMSWSAATTGN